jgi:hypothetical protein
MTLLWTRSAPARRSLVASVLLAAMGLAACASGPPPVPHAVLTATADPLRADFNRHIGHVRIVILAAPT